MLLRSQLYRWGWDTSYKVGGSIGPFRNCDCGKTGECHYQRHATHPGGASGLRGEHCYAPGMATYHVLAAGTVLWLLASAGATDSQLPVILTASLTAAALLLSHMVRSRREKQKL